MAKNNNRGLNPTGTGPLFGVNNESGMMVTRNVMTYSDSKAFLKKLYTSMIYPTTKMISAITKTDENHSVKLDNFQVIMNVFSSIRVDFDLFDLTILEDNASTRMMKESYERNAFYHLTASPVIDKKNGEVCILFEMYKSPEVDPNTFLDNIKMNNSEMLAFLYISQLISLAQKNYKNKFTLANRARMYMYQNNPKMDISMREESAVALAKMAMDFHTNSMILDNFNDRLSISANELENFNYLKNNPMVLYNPEYNYKMTHLDILEKLLEDADFEFVDLNDKNQFPSNMFNNNINGKDDNNEQEDNNDGTIDRDSPYSNRVKNDYSENDNTEADNNNAESTEFKDDDNNSISRDSPYAKRIEEDDSENNNINETEDNNSEKVEPKDDDIVSSKPSSDDGKFLKITFKKNKFKMFFMKMPPQKANNRYDRLDTCDERTCDALQNNIDYGMQKLKGTGMQDIFENLGAPIKIDMEWEKEIIRFVDNLTNMTNSNKYENTWRKSNNYTRHIAMMPGKRPLPDSSPTLYILFDQSGSMSNNIIRKINYIIEYFYKKKYNINVLIHDYTQNADDVNVYEFRPKNKSNINDNTKLDELITHRIMAGGTSHKGVFDLMEVYIKEVSQRDKKYSSHYCFICSDLYSDIEQIYKNYEWCKLIENTTFALCPEENMKLPFGKTRYIS